MKDRYISFFLVPMTLMLGLMMLFVYNAPGTGDFKVWFVWMNLLKGHGLYNTLLEINDNYPPFSLMILDAVVHLSLWTGLSMFFWLKMSLFLGLAGTCWVFYAWKKDPGLTVGLFLMLLVSVACGYLDIYWTVTLVAALWALEKDRYALSAALYTLSVMTKPQPMLLAPFLALYFIRARSWRELKQLPWSRIIPATAGGLYVLALFGAMLGAAAFEPLINALDTSGKHWGGNTTPSGNAMNVNWILTHILRAWWPDQYGPLDRGTASSIGDIGIALQLPSKLAFALLFLFILYRFFRQEKNMRTLLLYSALGALTCFILNTGMHENHLYVVPMLTVGLAALDRRYWPLHTVWAIAAAMNLLVFYGFGGGGYGYSRVVGIDMPVVFSVVYTLLFLLSLGWMFVRDDGILKSRNVLKVQEEVFAK